MPDVLDPSGFQISVVLRVGGSEYPLWVGREAEGLSSLIPGGDDSGGVLAGDVPIVNSVQIDVGMGLVGKASVEISAPYDLGIQLLESPLFAIGAALDVQIGYPRVSRFFPWFSTMTARPTVAINPEEGLQATLNGEGGAFAAARGSSSETFTGSYATIIKTIAAQESNQWNLDIPDEVVDDDPLYIERESVSQGNRSDWMFIQYICRMANYDCWIMPDPDARGATLLRLRRRSEALAGVPRYTFIARGQCDFINTFPILTFESSGEGIWLPAREFRTADINITNRETPPESSMRPEDAGVPTLPGDTTPGTGSEASDGTVIATEPAPRDARGTGRRIVAPAHAPEAPLEVLRTAATEGRQHGGLNATFSAIGLPDVYPGDVVKIVGVGLFSGNYVAESVSHAAQAGDWTMTVKLLGDGVSPDGVDPAVSQAWSLFNQEPAEEQDEAGGGGILEAVPETPG